MTPFNPSELGEWFELAPTSLFVTTAEGVVLACNQAAKHWLSGDVDLTGQSLASFFVDQHDFRQLQLMLAHDNGSISIERRLHHLNGKRYWAAIEVRPLRQGKAWMWSLRDLSSLHTELERLHLENQRFRHMLEASIEGYVVIDTRTHQILEVNPAFCRLLGLSESDVVGQHVTAFTLRDSLPLHQAMLKQLLEDTQQQYQLRLLATENRILDVQISCSTLFDDSGLPLCAVALVVDMTERKRNEERILYLALYDSLTALPNRLLLEERLQQALKERQRRGGLLALLFVDLDNFKTINDTLGHDVGDGLLQALAKRLHLAVRKSDTVARLGGDEFIVLLPEVTGRAAVAQVAAKLLQSLEPVFEVLGHHIEISCSIGIAIAPEDGLTDIQLKQQADKAMYVAKGRGKHQFAFCPQDPNHEPSV